MSYLVKMGRKALKTLVPKICLKFSFRPKLNPCLSGSMVLANIGGRKDSKREAEYTKSIKWAQVSVK